jgi:hypothetical protein
VQVVLVNQFGWDPDRVGDRVPKGMHMGHFRIATDVEFGMATYEPFGISPLEPLCAGAICCISNVCGCAGFVLETTGGKDVDNVIIADYTRIDHPPTDIADALAMTRQQRDAVEQKVSADVARLIMERFPRDAASRKEMLEKGQQLALARAGTAW